MLFFLVTSLLAATPVQGRILDRDGKPIAGAELLFFAHKPLPVLRVPGVRHEAALDRIWGPLSDEAASELLRLAAVPGSPPLARVKTGRDGRYLLRGLAPDVDLLVPGTLAWTSDSSDWWPEALCADPRPRELLVLEADTHRPIVGAAVTVLRYSPWAAPLPLRTDARGSASLSAVVTGHHGLIVVQAPGYLAEVDPSLSGILPALTITVELHRPAPIRGRVVENGRPVREAQVDVHGSFTMPVLTDAEGRFELPAPACLGCEVVARHGNSLGVTFVGMPRDVVTTVELTASRSVKVQVVDSVTRAPLKARFSWPDAKDQARVSAFHEDGPGAYSVCGVITGVHRLVVAADAHVSQDIDFSGTELMVPMAREHVVKGRLLRGGAHVSGGTATLLSRWKGSPTVKGARPPEKVPPSEVTCELDEVSLPFSVEANGEFEVELTEGDYLLRFEADGEPEFQARVPESSARYCRWLYDDFGVDTPRRRGELLVEPSSLWSEQRIHVPSSAPLVHTWRPAQAPVLVEVVDASGASAGDVGVVFERGGRVEVSEFFSDGEARLLLPPGRYRVSASALDGTARGRASVEVKATDALTTVRVQLR